MVVEPSSHNYYDNDAAEILKVKGHGNYPVQICEVQLLARIKEYSLVR